MRVPAWAQGLFLRSLTSPRHAAPPGQPLSPRLSVATVNARGSPAPPSMVMTLRGLCPCPPPTPDPPGSSPPRPVPLPLPSPAHVHAQPLGPCPSPAQALPWLPVPSPLGPEPSSRRLRPHPPPSAALRFISGGPQASLSLPCAARPWPLALQFPCPRAPHLAPPGHAPCLWAGDPPLGSRGHTWTPSAPLSDTPMTGGTRLGLQSPSEYPTSAHGPPAPQGTSQAEGQGTPSLMVTVSAHHSQHPLPHPGGEEGLDPVSRETPTPGPTRRPWRNLPPSQGE